MGSINKQISRYEFTAVYTHPEAKVDIVLVHGLNGDPQKTWTAKNGTFWPADLLPASLRDAKANILVYGYNADVYSKKHGSNPSDNFIYLHAQTLVTSLTHYRKDEQTSHNPIIWVCHSLGGILVKRALLYSNDLKASQHEDYRSVYVSTYGITFLGTPHTGSDMAGWGTILQGMSDAVVPRSFFHSEPVLLKTLKRDNETLQNINNHFLDIYQRFKILMAHENHKTDIKGAKMLIVDSSSAGPQLPGVTYYAIEATHSGMCKFESRNAPGYRTVMILIREWVLDAADVIATRWRVEDEERLARAKHEIEERMKPWIQSQQIARHGHESSIQHQMNETSSPVSQKPPSRLGEQSNLLLPGPEGELPPQDNGSSSQPPAPNDAPPSEPIFVKPAVFRPNTFFKGREKELKQLHKMLMDRGRRSSGTSSVLIQSMPGGGKSHLARQYVFQHKHDYPGGIFWIRAKSVKELEYGYWDIAKTAELSDAGDLDRDEERGTRRMVVAVRAWLNSTSNWLLVLDGIHFDFPDLQYYIPFTKDSSMIFTSTEQTVAEAYQFDYPQIIALDSLAKEEAQELLLDEMGKKKPWTRDDLSQAAELVESMDRLPLMIHVAAQHLRATREPLAKYVRSFKNRPRVGNLPAYHEVRIQLQNRGAVVALNLMYMLSFFGQHIPVEMVALGAKALGRSTPVKSSSPYNRRTSLNNTIQILISFALIERYQNNEASSASSRSNRSIDMGQENLDILRVHGIVQAFFVDVLADDKEAPFWLEQAVSVFCRAFDESKHRVKDDPQAGMPQDFRRFRIHGERLIEHLERFQRKAPDRLGPWRLRLDSRLNSIGGLIDQLSKRSSDAHSQSSKDMIVSVFERTNSLSEADSSTPPSTNSILEFYTEENTTAFESPSVHNPDGYNPYHWHVTYPYGVPPMAEGDMDISRTVTPQPEPTEIFEAISMPDDDETTQRVFGPNHRTIKKHAARRYRDHAGAWRASSQIISDPRVSISRETAKGFISTGPNQRAIPPPSTSDDSVAAGSEAEVALSQIQQGSPSLQNLASVLADEEQASLARPNLLAGRVSYASPSASETNPVEDHPITPTFSNIIGTYPAPSSSYTAATIMRLKENERPVSIDGLAPVKVSSPLASEPVTTTSLRRSPSPPKARDVVSETDEFDFLGSLPTIPISRSARSSPSQRTGPFASPPPIPIQVNATSSLRRSPEHAIVDDEEQPLARSLPSIRSYTSMSPYPYNTAAATTSSIHHHHPDSLSMQVHPPPWTSSPHHSPQVHVHSQGYTSQPMSRDPSHQSSRSQGSNLSSMSMSSSSSQQHHTYPRRPRQGSAGSRTSSPGPQTMQRPRSRRPSVVETEPSPRIGPLDGGSLSSDPVVTSYRLYNDNHPSSTASHRGGNNNNKRRGSGSRRAASDFGAAADLPYPVRDNTQGFFTRWRGRRRGGGGVGGESGGDGDGDDESSNGGSGSVGSGSGGGTGIGAAKGSKENTRRNSSHRRALSAGGRLVKLRSSRKHDSSDPIPSSSVLPSTAIASPSTRGGGDVGAGMIRSSSGGGSGGFKLPDGSMVGFGGTGVLPVAAAAKEVPKSPPTAAHVSVPGANRASSSPLQPPQPPLQQTPRQSTDNVGTSVTAATGGGSNAAQPRRRRGSRRGSEIEGASRSGSRGESPPNANASASTSPARRSLTGLGIHRRRQS